MSRGFACRAALQLVSIAVAVTTLSTVAPNVSQAGMIYAAGPQGQFTEDVGVSIWQELSPCVDSPAPASPSERPEPTVPEQQKVPHVGAELDVVDDATTSTPVSAGGAATQAGLATANLHLSLSGDSRRIRLFEQIAPDSPPPGELLDPPKYPLELALKQLDLPF